jgi:serine/threonine protein kinase
VLRIVGDTAMALDYAHQGGVIHRDVKPSNIMVMPSGHAVLTDFGLALSVPEGTLGNTFGSAHYIAPEQAVSSAQAVPQSDLYSLAVVLYQMLTGKVPFDDPSAMSVALKHISDPPPPIRRFAPDLPVAVEQVVTKALDKDVRKRFSDGVSMVRALEASFAPMLGTGLPPSSPSRPRPLSDGTGSRRPTDEFERIDLSTIPQGSSQIDRPTWTEKNKSLSTRPHDAPSSTQTQSLLRASIESSIPMPPRRRSWVSTAALLLAVIALLALAVFVINNNESLRAGSGEPTAIAAATDLVESTATAQDTPTDQATAPAFGMRTDTAVPVIQQTDEPTAQTAQETLIVTRTRPPTRTPTEPGIVAGETPTSSAEAATPAPELPLVLRYDAQTLVLYNQSDAPVNITSLYFVRLNQVEREIGFAALDWQNDAASLARFASGGCYQLWLISMPFQSIPAYCNGRFGWRAVGTTRQFWTSSEPDQTFEVRRNNQVLAICPTNVGECAFSLLP